MARSDALSAVQPFVDSVIKSLVSEYEDKLSSKQEYLDRLVREAQDARELNEALSSQCATLRQYVHQSTIEFQQIREKLLRYEQNGVDELKKVESSWREKDASKTKELDAAQAKLARVESKLNAALNNAPPPAGVDDDHCVVAIAELEALRNGGGGGVIHAEMEIKLEGKIEQVKTLQDKMARLEMTFAKQLAAKSAELEEQLEAAAALRADASAIQDDLTKRDPAMDVLEEKLADAETAVAEQQVALAAKEEALAELEGALLQQAEEAAAEAREAAALVREEMDAAFAEERAELERDWRHTVDGMQAQVEETNKSFLSARDENAKLYNEVQDLKGAIRVYCRVRPLLASDESDTTCVTVYAKTKEVAVEVPKVGPKMFSFDKVFAADVTQAGVYADMQPLMRCVLDGFNVALLAYGQTGSGKTFTMSGPGHVGERQPADTLGVNYRALDDLFAMAAVRAHDTEYTFTVQMLEIYNEQIRDLLSTEPESKALEVRLAIGPSGSKSWHVPDAAMRTVASTKEVVGTMREGERNRAVGQTSMNERSSRSHSVVSIQVAGKDRRSGAKLSGFLNLVDLAGSERVGRSEATGARLKEAQHINKSLSALGDVINAHANRSAHIPFRNSKLTTLLQDSLGGRAKVCMFVHVNPETASSGETLSTLYFAQRAGSVTLGGAKVNMESGEVEILSKNLKKAQDEIEQKEAEVSKLRQAARGSAQSAAAASHRPDTKVADVQRELMDTRKLQKGLADELKALGTQKIGLESSNTRMRAELDATKLAKDEAAAEVAQLKRDMHKLQVTLKQREAEVARLALSQQSSRQTSPPTTRREMKPISISPVVPPRVAAGTRGRPASAAVRSSMPAFSLSDRSPRPGSAMISTRASLAGSLAGSGQTTPRGGPETVVGTPALVNRLAAARKSGIAPRTEVGVLSTNRRASSAAASGRWM